VYLTNVIGCILCRLPAGSREIGEIGKLLRIWSHADEGPYFLIQEEYRASRSAMQVKITSDVIRRMIVDFQFRMPRVGVKMSKDFAVTEMCLYFNKTEQHPISGFPRSLLNDELNPKRELVHSRTPASQEPVSIVSSRNLSYHVAYMPLLDLQQNAAGLGAYGVANPTMFSLETRQALNANSFRWAGRTPSKHQHRKKWVAPALDPRRANTIIRYSSGDHFLGDGSADALRESAALLTHGPSPPSQNPKEAVPSNEIPRPGTPIARCLEMPAGRENEIFEMPTSYNASPTEDYAIRTGRPGNDAGGPFPFTRVDSASNNSDERQQILARALENRISVARDLNLIYDAQH
jgi:hypothetical protein